MSGMETYRYYYEKLSRVEREIYRSAETGILNFEKEFSLPKTDGRRLCEIIEMLRLDVPMIFHLKSFKYLSSPGRETVIFKPEYSVGKAEYLRTEGYSDREELVNEIRREMEGDKRYRMYSGFILSFDKMTGVCEIKMKHPTERETDSPVKTADKNDRREDANAQC